MFHLPVIIVIKPNSSSQTGGEISAPPHPAWREREFGAGEGAKENRRGERKALSLLLGRARKSFLRLGTNACVFLLVSHYLW